VGVPARGGGATDAGVDGVSGDDVDVAVFTDAEGGGRGERVRRVIGVVNVGEEEEREREREDVEGWLADERERGSGGGVPMPVPGAVGGRGEGVDALRWRREGRSGAGAERGVLRPERVGSSGVMAGDE
jgi:hypothetical protein